MRKMGKYTDLWLSLCEKADKGGNGKLTFAQNTVSEPVEVISINLDLGQFSEENSIEAEIPGLLATVVYTLTEQATIIYP